jgi:hypothetical protein
MKSIFQGTNHLGDGVLFLLGAEVGREQVAGGVGAGVLGEVDQIDGRAALFVDLGDEILGKNVPRQLSVKLPAAQNRRMTSSSPGSGKLPPPRTRSDSGTSCSRSRSANQTIESPEKAV